MVCICFLDALRCLSVFDCRCSLLFVVWLFVDVCWLLFGVVCVRCAWLLLLFVGCFLFDVCCLLFWRCVCSLCVGVGVVC